jgi:hypothetical protein
MAIDREALRDWHRLFGLLLADFFTGSPFTVEVERDLSQQQQLLDVVVVRRGRGQFTGRLPDGLGDLVDHNLISFKSHREALTPWAVKELAAHSVAYRKLVSRSPSDLLPEDRFRLYAVCARSPHNLAGLIPWQQRQAGVYDCQWGTDVVRVVVAGELPREPHNAPLHLFSASPELVGYGRSAYGRRSGQTSRVLGLLWESLQREGFAMAYTMEDLNRRYIKTFFARLPREDRREALRSLPREDRLEALQSLSPEDRREFLQSLPPEEQQELLQALPPEVRLAGLSDEQIRQYLEQRNAGRPTPPRTPRRRRRRGGEAGE